MVISRWDVYGWWRLEVAIAEAWSRKFGFAVVCSDPNALLMIGLVVAAKAAAVALMR